MRYKLLGRTGIKVSELCLGTMSFGDRWGFGADEATSIEVAAAYAEAGGNFLDTANKYHEGHTEEICGKIIAGNRDRWVLATKFTLTTANGDPNASGNSRKNMIQAVHKSLGRLGTDYIDLLWVHAWDFTTGVEEVMRGLDDLVRAGKVLSIGISDAPAWIVSQANTVATLRGLSPFAALQIEYSLIERTVERELIPMAEAFGITVTPWAPLGGGVLTGKYSRGSAPEDTKRAAGNEQRLSPKNLAIAKTVDTIADELGKTSAQVATNWVRQRGANVVPIVGARKASQIKDVIGSLDFTLNDDQLRRLHDVSRIELGFPHDFLGNPRIRGIVYGDRANDIDLPAVTRPR
ncbi:aldo/keto reductase [Polyangium mundeleinium]|uniref:Aldo/keto reductase n=1 Tax=Polyangium mundeleinium TaxID=2995306 RepID=A0ABT5F8Y3_9BACT|nr:aldo/keto reductase [Polyangium mundeleinium]MDC0749576.1 aldo/keto reductase [Polyangium mundeleinium]